MVQVSRLACQAADCLFELTTANAQAHAIGEGMKFIFGWWHAAFAQDEAVWRNECGVEVKQWGEAMFCKGLQPVYRRPDIDVGWLVQVRRRGGKNNGRCHACQVGNSTPRLCLSHMFQDLKTGYEVIASVE